MKRTYNNPEVYVCFLDVQDAVRTSLPIEENSGPLVPTGNYSTEWY